MGIWPLILRRLFWMIPTLVVISFISFAIIQAPPGDYLTSYIAAMEASGDAVSQERIEQLRAQYGLDRPYFLQYLGWLGGLSPVGWASGETALFWPGHPVLKPVDMGMSFEYEEPVTELIGERLALTVALSLSTLVFTWMMAIPIGVISAVRKYTLTDHTITLLGFIGLATPNFLLALLFMYLNYRLFGTSAGGLFSAEYQQAGWSVGKLADLLKNMWVPVIIIGTAGTAGLIRVMRGNLLDELAKQYVITARAKGLHPVKALVKYPLRVAINPVASTIGWVLPTIISGEAIVSIVLGLPTTGELLLSALMNQDMYLAGSMLMLLSLLTVIGTLISDILLILLDPRIRYDGGSR